MLRCSYSLCPKVGGHKIGTYPVYLNYLILAKNVGIWNLSDVCIFSGQQKKAYQVAFITLNADSGVTCQKMDKPGPSPPATMHISCCSILANVENTSKNKTNRTGRMYRSALVAKAGKKTTKINNTLANSVLSCNSVTDCGNNRAGYNRYCHQPYIYWRW